LNRPRKTLQKAELCNILQRPIPSDLNTATADGP
jgi:hypothetical protein